MPLLTKHAQIEKLFDVACTLTDVMSCVPFPQHTFEYGPRDYLNQLMNLISTLRGGQQRYLPLLLSKVQDAVPSMNPSPTFPLIPTNPSRFEELYDGTNSQSHSSNPNSGNSSPFHSPNLTAVGPTGYFAGGFGDLEQKQTPPVPPTSAGPFDLGASGLEYAELGPSVTPLPGFDLGQMEGFQPMEGPGKYEGGG